MTEMVFFDVGDTLLRPHPSFPELFSQVCTREGTPVDASTVEQIQERLAPHLIDLAHDTGVDKPSLSREDSVTFWSHLYRRFLAELGIEDEDLVSALYATFSNTSSYKLFDDVIPALDELAKDGFRLGVISNFEEWLQEMLVELEVGHLFEVTVISGVVGIEKPDLELYRIALSKAGVDAEAAVHVGDSPSNDVVPARAVGMKPVLIDRYDRYPSAEPPRITSLQELKPLIENL